ncbi:MULTISPECIES: rhomboid-like protein [unclassified Streptomyces]|uniref:rhomboid-like protein n=1 Tax=unclassified Streptomyces TaxID=2593676 RepID=UPI0036E205AF
MTVEADEAGVSSGTPPEASRPVGERESYRLRPEPSPAPPGRSPQLLDAIPAQAAAAGAVPAAAGERTSPETGERTSPEAVSLLRRMRPWRLLPTPAGTPFTFTYAAVLVGTSLFALFADPGVVASALRGSSTDVAHLAHTPVFVLVASALWIAGGITSPFAICFLVVLTALERRIGGRRTAGVFVLGHIVATLATEVPVGLSVMAGHLPESSLHRLDYGISFGVAASIGALAGLLTPWPRWTVLAVFGGILVEDLIEFTDPMTSWGHLMALAIGVGTWPLVRRWRRAPGPSAA